MNRTELIETVVAALKTIGLSPTRNEGTDLLLDVELLDARWTTGKRTIHYTAAIYFDEGQRTVFMHEKTVESGGGFSFGFEGGSSVQVGRTLLRKVKSVQYGPDGKALEYEFDLGAIPKAVEAAANEAGWKFRTVLRRSSALWPKGRLPDGPARDSLPTATTPGEKEGTPPPVPAVGSVKTSGATMAGRVLLGLWTLLIILLLLVFQATKWGWLSTVLILSGGFWLQWRLRRSGCLVHLGIGLLTVAFSIIALSLSATRTQWSSARVENAVMTPAVDESGHPVQSVSSFSPATPELLAAADLRHAPEGTRVRFVWSYLPENYQIASIELTAEKGQSDAPIFCRLTNQGRPWPEGDYQVEIYVDDRPEPDSVIRFSVVSSSP